MISLPNDAQMPFISADNLILCSLPVNGIPKLHFYDGEGWQRLATSLSEEAAEFAPYAEFKHGIHRVSFIGGDPAVPNGLALYRILSESQLPLHSSDIMNISAVVRAKCGFVSEFLTVYADGGNPVYIHESKRFRTILEFPDAVEYTQITGSPGNPGEIILCGLDASQQSFTRKFSLAGNRAFEMSSPNGFPMDKDAVFQEISPERYSRCEAPKCRFMEDTGRKAFVNIPCRGNAIICRRDGHLTHTHNCNSNTCRNFESKEKTNQETDAVAAH